LTLLALRSEKVRTGKETRTLAVIADPVFDKEDPRAVAVSHGGNAPVKEVDDEGIYLSQVLRGFEERNGVAVISRLPSTLREANAIMALTPQGEGMIAVGFDASKDLVVNDGLRNYRIIHFATHGLSNSEKPELSGVMLSLIDEHGNGRKGFLGLHDIYNLDLSSDLVVLSACRTGLGKNVQGEGIVGLSSGFMYAGAKSVVASLWKVDDDATAELMSRFYTAMLKDRLPPGEALKRAKLEIRGQKRWQAPFYWAAFVLQGEYAEDISAPRRASHKQMLIVGAALMLVVLCIYAFFRHSSPRA
jgi:CHAT domain-containing protein